MINFYCAEAKLAIELDGMAHDLDERPTRDALRDAWLEAQGLEIIRIAAKDVLRDARGVGDALVPIVLGHR